MSDQIKQHVADGVLALTIARPEKKNALTGAMYRALKDALDYASDDPSIRVVLLSGEGDAFCAGNDISGFLPENRTEDALVFIRAIAGFGKPIVAAVQGLAVGVGTTMLLHCDLVFAAPGTRFTVPFAKLGIVPEAAASLLLPQRLGPAKAAAMLLLGEAIDAESAERAGLITAVIPAEELLDHARTKAMALLAMPPRSLAETRRLMRGDWDAIERRLGEEEEAFRTALAGAEAQEAFSAFLEKRPPVFGREGAK